MELQRDHDGGPDPAETRPLHAETLVRVAIESKLGLEPSVPHGLSRNAHGDPPASRRARLRSGHHSGANR